MKAAHRVEYRVLGRYDVLVDGQPVAIRGWRQRAALIALLHHAGHEVSIAALVDALWADDPPETARKQVQNVVTGLRRTLVRAGAPAEVIETGRVGYRIPVGDDDLDLRWFERHVAAGRSAAEAGQWQDAVVAYRAALALWDGVPLDHPAEWSTAGSSTRAGSETVAVQLAERRLVVVEECLDAELAFGRHREVLGELHDAVAAHPFREGLRGQLMLALYRSGRQADALAIYRAGRVVLIEELGLEPGAALRQLEHAILIGDPALEQPAPESPTPPTTATASPTAHGRTRPPGGPHTFVGRSRELRQAEAAQAAVTGGRGSLIVVSGDAGIGKSRFCEELADRACHAGLAVAIARCWLDGGAPPLWPWQPLIAELCGADAADLLAGDSGHATVDPDRFARFAAVTERLAATCARTPACLVIDDLHAADLGTLLLTRFVARALRRLPLVLVLSRRRTEPEADTHEARQLAEIESEGSPIVLGQFDLEETSAFLSAHGLAPIDRELLWAVHRVTKGNPLFLRRVTAMGPSLQPDALPGGVRVAIDQAVEALSSGTQRVLRTSAVLGPNPSITEAAALASTDPLRALDAVGEAVTAGLVTPTTTTGPEGFAFSHELVRSVLEERLAADERLDAHARAASIIGGDAVVVPPDRLARRAHHALAAAPRSDVDARLAVAACREAAKAMVRSFAYEQADRLLSAAIELHQPATLGPPPGELLVEWAQAALHCGRMTEARHRFARAASTAESEGDPVRLAEAALGLGGHWVNEHRTPVERARVLGLQRSALDGLPRSQNVLRCRLQARLAAEAVFDGAPIEPVYEALDAARRSGDPGALAEALSLSFPALFTPQHASGRRGLADELVRVGSEAGQGVLALMGLCWRAVDLFQVGDPGARRALEDLRDRANALACQNILYVVAVMDVMLLIRHGRLDEAEQLAGRSYELGEAVGEVDTLAYLSAHILAIRWLQGRDAELVGMADEISASPTLVKGEFAFRACAALLAARAGREESARSKLDSLAADGLASLPHSSNWMVGILAVAETAAALRDVRLAREAYDLLLPFAALPTIGSVGTVCLGSTERGLGVAALAFGEIDRAVDHLERAVAANLRLGNRPFTAVARAELSLALRRRDAPGDRSRAAEQMDAAVTDANVMGLAARASAWRAEMATLDDRVDRADRAGGANRAEQRNGQADRSPTE
jgi:DNA-binding SARP family transcriptional activator/tetratricopeptide (TPR) repeat protein